MRAVPAFCGVRPLAYFIEFVLNLFRLHFDFKLSFSGTSIALKKREGGGCAAGGGAAAEDDDVDDDGDDGDDSSNDGGGVGGGGAAAVSLAIQENLFLDDDVELPDDFE